MNQVNFSKSVIIRTNPEFIMQINNGNKKQNPALCSSQGWVLLIHKNSNERAGIRADNPFRALQLPAWYDQPCHADGSPESRWCISRGVLSQRC